MKNLLILATMLLSFQLSKAQSAYSAASDHVFQMCDTYGTPATESGQYFYFVFYSNGKVNILWGSNLSKALDKGAIKTGTWKSSGRTLWVTWSDGKRSEDLILDIDSGNFISASTILIDLGGF